MILTTTIFYYLLVFVFVQDWATIVRTYHINLEPNKKLFIPKKKIVLE
jgi:hypothetical protein